jgi:dipeptidyl aminopeptidase/acylaminoacyl peptidase
MKLKKPVILLGALLITAFISYGLKIMFEKKSALSYIPRQMLFAPHEVLSVKISPDSSRLAYVKSDPEGVMNIFVCQRGDCQNKATLKQLTHFTTPDIYRFFWTGDSKKIVFMKDENGAKAYRIYTVDVDSGNLINHTESFAAISPKIFKVSGNQVAVGINDRNPSYHDVYLLNTSDNTLTKHYENDQFSRFTFDDKLGIVLQEIIHEDGSVDVYKGQQLFAHFSPEDAFHSHMLNIQGSTLYFVDTRNSDTTWLRTLDLITGEEKALAHDLKSDIGDLVFVDGKPSLYSTTWLKKEWHSLGGGHLEALLKSLGSSFEVISQSPDYWVIRTTEPTRIGPSFHLFQRSDESLVPLHLSQTHPMITDMHPFEFISRDGLALTAYLTLPPSYSSPESVKKPIPLIVIPHGGPFQARDSWTFDPRHPWLASRGYAVLSVNFRLSSGLGKNLVNAGNGEWGRKANDDLMDAVQWCIDQGITTKSQVGIMGASYGGYATLSALAFTPDDYVVGIDLVGPSSLITVSQHLPKYWDWSSYPLSDTELFFTKGAFVKSIGADPANPADLPFLASRSPLNYAADIKAPLLIIQGDHDPIVRKEESQQIFDAMKKSGQQVRYLSFSDEGHQFKRYPNIDVYLAHAEKWLHDALGGSYEPLNEAMLNQSSVKVQE